MLWEIKTKLSLDMNRLLKNIIIKFMEFDYTTATEKTFD